MEKISTPNSTIVIKPTGGLCNYLRVVFSYWVLCQKQNLLLKVIWRVTPYCPGFFLDYFEPIENTIFVQYQDSRDKIYYSGCAPVMKPNYEKLILKPFLQKMVSQKMKVLGDDYISCHIRRTDHSNLAKIKQKYKTDYQFKQFLNKWHQNIYIATDNIQTYNKFHQIYKTRMKFPYHEFKNQYRHTTLRDAIIDLYMCVNSKIFEGSGYSSFTDLILDLRSPIT